jgi:hypothetical protein
MSAPSAHLLSQACYYQSFLVLFFKKELLASSSWRGSDMLLLFQKEALSCRERFSLAGAWYHFVNPTG